MSLPKSVSVLMPTWQGMEFLDRVLEALSRQECSLRWDLWVTDSGSSDGTWERLQEWAERFPVPMRVDRIHQAEFDHGDTRNRLAARSAGELLVFLTQDAIPVGPTWLQDLAAEFEDPEVGGAYCRNLPRPDALDSTRVLSRDDPGWAAERKVVRLPEPEVYAGMSADERRLLYSFQDVASAIRRSFWERHPMPRTWFGEDVLAARALLEDGHAIVYSERAAVEHSHDYDAREMRSRGRIDGRFNQEWLGRTCIGRAADIPVLLERLAPGDREAIRELAPAADEQALVDEVRELRRAAFEGLLEGGRAAASFSRAATAARATGAIKVLYVVHGFPPDTWAGTEVYTLGLARGLAARGHEVAVFTRTPAGPDGPADFSVEEGTFEELRVWRMTHRLEHPDLRASYEQPAAEAAFARVLATEQPDVVHFQHLIHTSTSLVRVAKDAGCATVVHCHDYWGLCPRVQLIRPDGEVCEQGMGSGCFACVKEKSLESIPRLAALDGLAGPALRELARRVSGTEVLAPAMRRKATEYLDLRDREEVVLQAYADCDLQVSPSRFLRDRYLATGRFDPHRFLFSENGLRVEHLHAAAKTPRPGGVLRVGFIGSLVWYKGVGVLVEAMQQLAGLPIELVVHGGFAPEEDAHHAELRELAAGTQTRFLGRFDNGRLPEIHRDLDVLVVPSLWFENAPVTIAEAFACGTPLVVSGFGGMAEFVRDGVDGLHFEPGRASDLARQLRRLLEEPGLLASLGASFPRPKTVEEDAADWEYRYRGLACMEREAASERVLAEWAVREGRAVEGETVPQGSDLLLVLPGAALDYDLPRLEPGPVRLELEQFVLGAEPELTLSGTVSLGSGEEVTLEPCRADGEDRTVVQHLDLDLPAETRSLRLRTSPEGGHLRLARLALRARPGEPA